MSEESKLILKMLSEGKIDAEQAEQLLRACKKGDDLNPSVEQVAVDPVDAKMEEGPAQEVGSILSQLLKDLNVGDLFNGLRGNRGVNVEHTLEGDFTSTGPINIKLRGKFGRIDVEPWSGKGYKAHCKMRIDATSEKEAEEKVDEALIYISQDDGLEIGIADEKLMRHLSIELFVPQDRLYELKLQTKHGRITTQGIEVNHYEAVTSHGRVVLDNIVQRKGRPFSIQTSHGKVELNNVVAPQGQVSTSHASINVNDCHIADLEAQTSHGKVSVDGKVQKMNLRTTHSSIKINASSLQEGQLDLQTSHSSISVMGDIPSQTGVDFMGITTHGRVSIEHPYLGQQKAANKLQLQTEGWEDAAQKLKIRAKTSHGSIKLGVAE